MIATIAIDGLPHVHRFQSEAQATIDPVLDVTGFWQGAWTLFSPKPDSLNERLFATVDYADGTTASWSSPDWRSMSAFERFTSFRRLEYFDDVANGATPELFSHLADHIVDQTATAGDAVGATRGSVVRVTIEVSRVIITDPKQSFEPLDAFFDFSEREVLHVQEYQ